MKRANELPQVFVQFAGHTISTNRKSLEDGSILMHFGLLKDFISYWYLVDESQSQIVFNLDHLIPNTVYTLTVSYKRNSKGSSPPQNTTNPQIPKNKLPQSQIITGQTITVNQMQNYSQAQTVVTKHTQNQKTFENPIQMKLSPAIVDSTFMDPFSSAMSQSDGYKTIPFDNYDQLLWNDPALIDNFQAWNESPPVTQIPKTEVPTITDTIVTNKMEGNTQNWISSLGITPPTTFPTTDPSGKSNVRPPQGFNFYLGDEFPSVVVKNQLFKPHPSVVLVNESDGRVSQNTPPDLELYFVNVSLVSARDQKRTFQLNGNGRIHFGTGENRIIFKNLRTSSLSSKYGDCKFQLKFEISREDSPLPAFVLLSPPFQVVAKIPKDSKLILERLIPATVPSNHSVEVSLLGYYPVSPTANFDVIICVDGPSLEKSVTIRCERAGRGLFFKTPTLLLNTERTCPVYITLNGVRSPKPKYLTFLPPPANPDELSKYWNPEPYHSRETWTLKEEEE